MAESRRMVKSLNSGRPPCQEVVLMSLQYVLLTKGAVGPGTAVGDPAVTGADSLARAFAGRAFAGAAVAGAAVAGAARRWPAGGWPAASLARRWLARRIAGPQVAGPAVGGADGWRHDFA